MEYGKDSKSRYNKWLFHLKLLLVPSEAHI